MHKFFTAAALGLTVAMPAVAQDLDSERGQLGYSIGYEFGSELQSYDIDVDLDAVLQAIREAYNEQEPSVELEIMRTRMAELQEKLRQERMEAFEALAEENQAKADEYLAENSKKKNIVTLPSGVQYRIIDEGDGKRPTLEDTVTVHYRGSKIDGREFDSSFRRGVPAVFQVNAVIEGWQEVLPLMREGAEWHVYLPPELAFGVRGDPPIIGPNEALKFDIKLVQLGAPEGFDEQGQGAAPGQ